MLVIDHKRNHEEKTLALFSNNQRFLAALTILISILSIGQIHSSADRNSNKLSPQDGSANLIGGCSQPFSQEINIPIGLPTVDIDADDFNGDNRADLVVSHGFPNNSVSVLLNNGNNSFSAPINFPIQSEVTDITIADFNNDNNLDIAVGSTTEDDDGGSITTLLGNGAGAFTPIITGAVSSRSITAGDFDRDGNVDVAVADNGRRLIYELRGDGTGRFPFGPSLPLLAINNAMIAGDFNNDGHLDLSAAVTNFGEGVAILLGSQFGLQPVRLFDAGPIPNSIATGDFNKDGNLDIATGNEYSFSILLGSGNGLFNITSIDTGKKIAGVVAQDINNDSNLDIIGILQDNSIAVMFGDGTGKFKAIADVVKPIGCPFKMVAADFNGDGVVDLASGNGSCTNDITILFNSCPALSCPNITITTTSLPAGAIGIPYQQSLTVTGGRAPYSFVSKSNLPPGLLLSRDGKIYGTPKQNSNGNYNFSVAVQDANGCVADDRNYTLLIGPPPPPTITNFLPASAPETANITINGDNFVGVTAVKFNDLSANFTVRSNQQIVASVPVGTSAGPITITTLGGTVTSANNFSLTTTLAPTVSVFTPNNGVTETAVTITGNNLNFTTAVKFNSVDAKFTVNSNTSITAIVPISATTGKITIINPAGMVTTATNYTVRPKITSFSPIRALANRSVNIFGSGFSGVTSVKINNVAVNFTILDSTEIFAPLNSSVSTGKISITTPTGIATSADNFTVIKTPIITSFSPISAPVGTTITINGSNFDATMKVTFNNIQPVSFTIVSNSMIRAVVPSVAQTGRITVTNRAGTATSTTDFKVLPGITSFTPTIGVAGASVTILGKNLTGTTAVRFNNVNAAFTLVSDTQINATVPATASSGLISITTPGGIVNSATSFIVVKPPTISSFSPSSGAVDTKVTINGANLNGVTAVTFNGVNAAFTLVSATSLTATVPANTSTGRIVVTNVAGIGTSSADFRVLPKITGFSPTSGIVGDSVIITGTNFTGASSVKFGTITSSFQVNSDTQITAVVPANAITNKINITVANSTISSATNFTIIQPPRITSFTPFSGRAGTVVTINGANFVAITSVKFNGVDAASFTIVSPTTIRATVATGTTTGKISIANRAGTITSTGTFTVTAP